ncbi:MAG: hypothetical protein WB992_16780, partial [Bryobacteraceae bacterium]
MNRQSAFLIPILGTVFALIGMTAAAFASSTEGCGRPPAVANQPWRIDDAVAFKTRGLAVDADGAPNSYL